MGEWRDLFVLLGGFAASAFALVRLTLAQQKAVTDRFVGFLESSIQHQDETIDGFREAVSTMTQGVQENTQLLRRVAERFHVVFNDEEKPCR
jgi:uncharacterized coiled-coil protein SlyX